MNAGKTARERVRAELIGEIKAAARRQMAENGAGGLSLRAVARELGMVSSAIYRYFPSRDDLLTALIIEAFDALGEAAERADAGAPRDDHTGRWLACCRAIRGWALAHPHEYALIHGSPVPGYVAPQDTAASAARDGAVLAGILRDAAEAGRLAPPPGPPPVPESFSADAARLRTSLFAPLSDDVILRAIMAWTHIYGAISFELFGMYHNVIDDPAAVFEHAARTMAHLLGLPEPATAAR